MTTCFYRLKAVQLQKSLELAPLIIECHRIRMRVLQTQLLVFVTGWATSVVVFSASVDSHSRGAFRLFLLPITIACTLVDIICQLLLVEFTVL